VSIKQAGKVLPGVVMPVISVRIDRKSYEKLWMMARARGTGVSSVAKEIIMWFLQNVDTLMNLEKELEEIRKGLEELKSLGANIMDACSSWCSEASSKMLSDFAKELVARGVPEDMVTAVLESLRRRGGQS
jgi:predicted DNA-binding protein